MSEAEYHELVAVWLDESFADVEHEVYLDSGRWVDFVARTPFTTYAIEVEDNWEGVYSGIGQAIGYAAELGGEGIVVLPADAVEDPEYTYIVEFLANWAGATRQAPVTLVTV